MSETLSHKVKNLTNSHIPMTMPTIAIIAEKSITIIF